jgi:hypothetical protein
VKGEEEGKPTPPNQATDPTPQEEDERGRRQPARLTLRCHRPPLRQRRLTKLDGEAIPLGELVQLALGNGELDGLVVVEIRRLVLQILRGVAVVGVLVVVVVVSTLDEVVGFALAVVLVFLIGEDVCEFLVEELNVAEVFRSATRVKL